MNLDEYLLRVASSPSGQPLRFDKNFLCFWFRNFYSIYIYTRCW